MDERLSKALEFSNYMVTLNNQKRILKEKYSDYAKFNRPKPDSPWENE